MINFEYKSGILEAADPASDRSWCWFKCSDEVVISDGGQIVGTLSVPDGAGVVQVKTLIREDARRAR